MISREQLSGPSEREARQLTRGIAMAGIFREAADEVGAQMPASYMMALMLVALKPGIQVVELSQQLGWPHVTASRVLLELGVHGRSEKRSGYGLVESTGTAEDLRARVYYLTPKGSKLIKRVIDAMTGSSGKE